MPSSQKTMDRVVGLLATMCAGVILVVIGARAGTSLSAIFRGSTRRPRGRTVRRRSPSSRCHSESGDDCEGEDGYHSYVHGSRSGKTGGSDLVLHCGGCHCGALTFEVYAADHLAAVEGPSKVRYPFITVPSERFRLTSDDSNGALYLAKSHTVEGHIKISAHFFCRSCGVHIVHAPNFPHAVVADVNVHCIDPSTVRGMSVALLADPEGRAPGSGEPVRGVGEVGGEAWSDATRERIRAALHQPAMAGRIQSAAEVVDAVSVLKEKNDCGHVQ
ncbi:unnamed protein product, partial [Discosporangium mesarthrocarpum]